MGVAVCYERGTPVENGPARRQPGVARKREVPNRAPHINRVMTYRGTSLIKYSAPQGPYSA